jgi:hypothetical protein
MSLRSRLSSALGALLGEPVPPSPDLAKALDEQRALTEYERVTRRRYSLHLDDIRCDLADAGIPIPEDDDPETTPRRMVRALIGERVAPAKPAPAVPEVRRMAILRAVDARPFASSAARIGNYLSRNEESIFNSAGGDHIASDVRRLVDEGYLVVANGKRGGPLALTEKGRAALADSARVAS